MGRVELIRGGSWDSELIRRELGVDPLPIPPVEHPVLTVDGYIEPDATGWLAHVHARTRSITATKTAATYAESLRQLLNFLLDNGATLRSATRAHITAYVRRRTVDEDTRVSGNTWSRDRTTIKQFYEWLQETHRIAVPFTLDAYITPHGAVTSMREGRNVHKASATGTPLEPPQAASLVAAAWRPSPTGIPSDRILRGARDAAFIALGLACGARANTLAHLTIYDLPNEDASMHRPDFIEMRLPAATAKTRREVRLPAFRHWLDLVWAYAKPHGGARTALLKDWVPKDPIIVAQPPTPQRRTIIDIDGNQYPLATMTEQQRRRLLTPDGTPAMLFISARDGAPLSYASAREITATVSDHAQALAQAGHTWFPHVHTHDLRHTYATHLAACFLLGVPVGPGRDMHGRPHAIDIRSAVSMAASGLGHLSEETTALYVQQVGLMALRYTLDDFLGRP